MLWEGTSPLLITLHSELLLCHPQGPDTHPQGRWHLGPLCLKESLTLVQGLWSRLSRFFHFKPDTQTEGTDPPPCSSCSFLEMWGLEATHFCSCILGLQALVMREQGSYRDPGPVQAGQTTPQPSNTCEVTAPLPGTCRSRGRTLCHSAFSSPGNSQGSQQLHQDQKGSPFHQVATLGESSLQLGPFGGPETLP